MPKFEVQTQREPTPSSPTDDTVALPSATAVESTTPVEGVTPVPSSSDPEPLSGLIEPAISSPWERYEDLGLIGRGGMGEVRRVRDRVMGRVLAMKLLFPDLERTPGMRSRFLAEARLTAGLQHPGIVPVHDCGALSDGRLWFTMQEIRGRTLDAVIQALHADAGDSGPAPESMRRVLEIHARVCEAVAYAHSHGVVHRDLKPDNVMIGEFGAVFVLDWGIARAAVPGPEAPRDVEESSPDMAAILGPASRTHAGGILGTPSYMAPEQALGDRKRIGRRTDVYALGALLYEILCGQPPYAGTGAWSAVIFGPPASLEARCRGPVPLDLVALCERAMAREPADRPANARILADEMRGFLDGARRRERARALVAEARRLAPSIQALRARSSTLRADAQALLGQVHAFDPAARKAPGWALEDEARALEFRAAQEEVIWQRKLRAALDEAPDLDEAHEALADAHAAELRAAETARDAAATARAEALLREHDRGRHAALLAGDGAFWLLTSPVGAEVSVSRYVERDRRLVLEPAGHLGRTPILGARLPRGSYMLHVRADGHHEMRYPVLIGRGAPWDGIRPGATEPFVVPIARSSTLGDADIYVPAGWFLSGGDAAAVESLPGRRLWLDGFVIRRHPVTQAEYLVFLNDLVDRGREPEAIAACPRAARATSGGVDVPLFPRDERGHFQPGPHTPVEHASHPAASMTWFGASLYAAWYAERTGFPWRLAGELEREKAARGVDGRAFPWGDQPETTWACMVSSRPGQAGPAPIEDYPTDESPYGVRGLAGNVREWCADPWTPEGPDVTLGAAAVARASDGDPGLRSIRGGAWSAAPPTTCSAASRFAARPDECFSTVGLRLARFLTP
ncbi:serine/threonine protein kinase [Minicystis rosea]|nr:serine/threonine protein kinase [Minicystis rosea]